TGLAETAAGVDARPRSASTAPLGADGERARRSTGADGQRSAAAPGRAPARRARGAARRAARGRRQVGLRVWHHAGCRDAVPEGVRAGAEPAAAGAGDDALAR